MPTILKRDLGADVAHAPGAGAAGGLGAGLLAFARAELVPGARLVFEALRFDERIAGADLIFTAEGRLDAQTAYGKAVGAAGGGGPATGYPGGGAGRRGGDGRRGVARVWGYRRRCLSPTDR